MAAAAPQVLHRRCKRSTSAGFGLALYACAVLSGSLTMAAIAAVLVVPEFVRALHDAQERHDAAAASTTVASSSRQTSLSSGEDALPKVADGAHGANFVVETEIAEAKKAPEDDADRDSRRRNESSSPVVAGGDASALLL
ncbi:hypothetical protein V5799_003183 [Amblyomma americanum]|uniref:Uncharacterized protein n=1 Tax=Amblyomma americanum TaxID=6943 RepID=A0AAQ4D9Q7_AMBAM